MSCPSADTIQSVIEGGGGSGPAGEREAVLAHAETCDACRALLGELVRQATPEDERAPPLGAPGSRIGPFLVTGVLGEGAMGVVVSAHDPDLDRDVAIKLLHADQGAERAPGEAQARLLREAQAMAKISHPGVITVHQVGTIGDEVFVVMEKVAGGTLRAWLRAKKRTWREIRDVFASAGRGLATAHAAGLVHRDFKPENVLVGDDGRVRVTDFGLVGVSASPAIAADDAGVDLTRSGALLGTPRYMAPEQHRRHDVDARADQFSFCVALYEALYGQAPFAGESLRALADEVCAGRVREPRGDAPAWLRRAVLRGLRVAPEERYASMDALLVAMARDQILARRWRALAGVAAGAAVAVAVAWAVLARPGPRCDGGEAQLAGVWDAGVKAAVQARFAALAKPWTAPAFERVAAGLDARARELTAQHREACLATARGEQSAAALDLRMQCLRRRLVETRALTELLAGGDAELLTRSPRAVASLSDLSDCADLDRLEAPIPPPTPAVRAQVERIRDVLEVARAEFKAGRGHESILIAATAAIAAQALGYRPLEAEAVTLFANLLVAAGDAARAEPQYRRAVLAADAGRHDAVRLEADIGLLDAVVRLHQFDRAQHLAEAAEAALERRGDDPKNKAYLAMVIGGMYDAQGKLAEARERYLESLALRERYLGPNDFAVAGTLNGLGNIANQQAKWDEAIGYYDRAIAIAETAYGPSHPYVALMLGNLGQTLLDRGQLDRAQSLFERERAIQEQAFGPDNPKVAVTVGTLGRVYKARGDYATARALAEQALAIYERAGVEDGQRATPFTLLGRVELDMGELDEALVAERRALDLRQRLFAPDHWVVADSHSGIGAILAEQGKSEEALAEYHRAGAIFAKALGPDTPQAGYPILNAGIVLASQKRFPEARERIVRARAIFEKAFGPDHETVATALRVLGDTYLREGRYAEGLAEEQRALGVMGKVLAPDNVEVAAPLTGIGRAQVSLGRAAEAIPLLERALALRMGAGRDPIDAAETRFALARALWESRRDRARAWALATEARAAYGGARSATERAEVDAWLARHRL